jgi:hypothetical protein
MNSLGGGFKGMREAGASGLRDGFERLARASAAIVRHGTEDGNERDQPGEDVANGPSATVSISPAARQRSVERVRSEDLLGNLLELNAAGVTVAAGVAVLKTADEMERTALSVGESRERR